MSFLLMLGDAVVSGGGCFYKRRKQGTTGMAESCPNIDFWQTIPGYVKVTHKHRRHAHHYAHLVVVWWWLQEGILYTRAKISGAARGHTARANGTYENL